MCVAPHILNEMWDSILEICLSPRTLLRTESKIILYTRERNILLNLFMPRKVPCTFLSRVSSIAYVYMMKCVSLILFQVCKAVFLCISVVLNDELLENLKVVKGSCRAWRQSAGCGVFSHAPFHLSIELVWPQGLCLLHGAV